MNRFLRLAALASVCMIAACNTVEPVHNAENIPVPAMVTAKMSDDQVGSVIKSALLNRGWTIDDQQPGMIHANLKWYNHSAEAGVRNVQSCFDKDQKCSVENYTTGVTITYTNQSYNLQVDPTGTGSLPEGTTYHQFNNYLTILRTDIDRGLMKAVNP